MMYRAIWIALVLASVNGLTIDQKTAWSLSNKNTENLVGIVGGHVTTIEHHPHQVHVAVKKNYAYYNCGGSIISAQFILTAAHCMIGMTSIHTVGSVFLVYSATYKGRRADSVTVRAGTNESHSGGIEIRAKLVFVHSLYNPITLDYDVAVIKLSRYLPLNGITMKAVNLATPSLEIESGTLVTVSGWGYTAENGEESINLRAVTVSTISLKMCQKLSKHKYLISPRMICAGVKGGKDTCQGDSGGPAVAVVDRKHIQVGIVSFSYRGCARPNVPGVYTSVAAVRTWIKSATGI